MTPKCILLLFLAGVCIFVGTHAQADCKGKVGNSNYNLEPLAKAFGDNDATTQDAAGNTYYYRPCKVVKQADCGQGPTNPANPATCQKDNRMVPKYHNCGITSSAEWKPRTTGGDASGFILHFNAGEDSRQSDIEFICDAGAGTGALTALTPAENPTHYYHLQWKSNLACPGGDGDGDGGGDGGDGDDDGGISGGWIFIIILVCIAVLYVVGGVIYKRVRTEDRGIDMIPNKDFWFSLPLLVVAGHLYIWRKLRGLCGANYETV